MLRKTSIFSAGRAYIEPGGSNLVYGIRGRGEMRKPLVGTELEKRDSGMEILRFIQSGDQVGTGGFKAKKRPFKI